MNYKNRLKTELLPSSSSMRPFELVCAILWIPMHTAVLPVLFTRIPSVYALGEARMNLLVYSIGVVILAALCWKFLRRDFDTLCDNFAVVLLVIVRCYLIMFALEIMLSTILSIIIGLGFDLDLDIANQNNDAVTAMAGTDHGITSALAIFLAPVLEELMFRGAIFGGLRNKNRTVAYIVAVLAFGVYHVWPFAIEDPLYWLYILQYVPVSYLLCYCYEKCDSIWGSILFHSTWNAVNLRLLEAASELL